MTIWEITDSEIEATEKLLLPDGCHFADDAKEVIRFWDSTDIAACPGSGKTTILLAKLKLIADHMPLDRGAGICVLSHTNVAINEIKTKLTGYSEKLMSYPNYIGTIQSFIDRYITLPYLKTLTSEPIHITDNRTYAQHLSQLIASNRTSYTSLIGLIKVKYEALRNRYTDSIAFIAGFSLNNGNLVHEAHTSGILAGTESNSAKQYAAAQEKLLLEDGIITYERAYQFATQAINSRPELTNLLSRRFRFVFVDEYQDCSELQRKMLEQVFDRSQCSVFFIGDPDQAIYNSNRHNPEDWKPEDSALHIASSNRYSQEIADVLTPLRTGKSQITSLRGICGCTPTIIVFDDSTQKKVIGAFISLLEQNGLTDPDGVYKAVGWVKAETTKGLKIGDYWDAYSADTGTVNETKYWSMIDALCDELAAGKLYRAENITRRLLCQILHYLKLKDDDGNTFTFRSVVKALDDKHFDSYREGLLTLSRLSPISRETIDVAVKSLVNSLFEKAGTPVDVFAHLPTYFLEDGSSSKPKLDSHNTIKDPIRGRIIHLSTVHKVKGETHDATLYLETVNARRSDLQRVLPYFTGKKPGNGQLDNYSRKIVYVGFSRPKKFLCVAMRAETYEEGKTGFCGWDVYDCREQKQ